MWLEPSVKPRSIPTLSGAGTRVPFSLHVLCLIVKTMYIAH